MKILIMVLSCVKPPYDALHAAQLNTWDSIDVKGVDTLYYWCDEYNMMHIPFREALKERVNLFDYDFIFRTNASSYVNKKALLLKAESLLKEKCYCGINGGGHASGSGVFISKDLFQYIIDGLKDEKHGAEDVYIGQVLKGHGIDVTPGAQRFDLTHKNDILSTHYHYRCKSDTEDRSKDIIGFNKIHKYLHG
jgi:hypothetical protein